MRFSGLDLIVLSSDLVDMEALAVIDRLGSEDRTKNIPVVVVGAADQVADDAWRNLYKGKAKGLAGIPDDVGLAPEEFTKIVSGAFSGSDPDATARYQHSARILAALAHTDTDNALFNWNALTETLAGLLTADLPEDPPVRLNAIRAMANIGDQAGMAGLVTFFGSDAADDQRAAAGMAIAAICRKGETTLDDASFGTLLKGTRSTSDAVRKAAFAALGSAALTPDQSVQVATKNRPFASTGD